ncbi:amidase [Nocardioides sp. cx-173]|uniref:amidase family protein n=1 Tax=Nocardioides sp. cx-173 TaxID=2898796 RepID=UPI001E5AFED6|nr:amidase [Nocardioides sp. cx-173]MCD4524029.1 amidase [Nocardioides sp. cx-173]UGB41430.1 amidase [Nocardioides sp. cx-173]
MTLRSADATLRAFTHVADDRSHGDGPLAGMPVVVKEIIDVAGMPVGLGSALFADRVPRTDAEAVARLRAAGAVIAAITTSTPFACGTTTPTDNPRAPGHTPGGSSAGSAAAVGAGLVPVALASQSQASTIRPASYCGVWGFKPSHLALPRGGMHLLSDTLDDLGVMASSLTDLSAVLDVLGVVPGPPAPPRVGLLRLDDGGLPRPETRAALAGLVSRMRGLGVEIVDADPGLAAFDAAVVGSGQACFDLFAGESAALLRTYVAAGEPDPRLREMVAHADAIGPEGLAAALRHRAELQAAWADLTPTVDLVLTLSTTNPAPSGHATTGCRRMPATASLLGVPALSAPWLTVDGLPQGVQLLGFAGGDAALLGGARWLDTLLQGDR